MPSNWPYIQVITGPLFINRGWMMHFVILTHVYICTWQAVMLCLYAWSFNFLFLQNLYYNFFSINFKKKNIDRNHISVLYISFFISKNALDHLITLKFPDRSVYRWLQIWPWHPLQSVILGLISRKRWMSLMWKPIDHSLMSPMINWRKLLNIWTDLLEVNYIQTYDVASENARTLDGLNFNLSIESSSFIKVK